MQNLLRIDQIKDKIHFPIAICDGGDPNAPERYLMQLFEYHDIPFSSEFNLYSRKDYDLSQYQTIAFGTFDPNPYPNTAMQKIFSFDKEKLKTVIVLSKHAFIKVEKLVGELKIDCLGFIGWQYKFLDPFTVKDW